MSVWSQRPNIDYQLAYDLCAQRAAKTSGMVLLIASSPFHAGELTSRLPGERTVLIPAPHWTPLPDDPLKLVRHSRWADLNSVNCIIWAEPTISQLDNVLQAIDRVLPTSGVFCTLVSGRLAGRLSEWRARRAPAPNPSEAALGWAKTEQMVFPPERYVIRQRVAFRGLPALAWDYAGQLAARFGRDDLADRCGVAMRASFVAPAWARSFSTVGVIVAEKTGRQGR